MGHWPLPEVHPPEPFSVPRWRTLLWGVPEQLAPHGSIVGTHLSKGCIGTFSYSWSTSHWRTR